MQNRSVLSRHSFLPNAEQLLLLKAALLSGNLAIEAWQAWANSVEIDRLNWGEIRLLPLLYYNLKQQGIPPSEIPAIYKGVYRRTWAENQLLFDRAKQTIEHLEQAGIPTLLLKGVALATQDYPEYGLRPMSDFDVLIPVEATTEAIYLLKRCNWIPKPHPIFDLARNFTITTENSYLSHSWVLINEHQQQLDLHWHVLNNSLSLDADREFWQRSIPCDFLGVKTRTLDPVDRLFHVCTHGTHANIVSPIRWISDAIMILNRHPNLDWNLLIQQSEKHRLMLPMAATLKFLSEEMGQTIPIEIIAKLNKIIPTAQEIDIYTRTISTAPKVNSFHNWYIEAVVAYCHKNNLSKNTTIPWYRTIYELPFLLKERWYLKTVFLVPFALVNRIIAKLMN